MFACFVMLLFNFVYYVFLLLCSFCSVYSVSLCCSVYCLCVNVYCTVATGCQPNCSQQIYHISCQDLIRIMDTLHEDLWTCMIIFR
jgi:hypothetical protein